MAKRSAVRTASKARRAVPRAAGGAPKDTGTLDLALRILDHLAAQNAPVALTAIAQAFAASKSTVYRHLSALARHGFVRRDTSTGRYAIGVKLMVLGETSRSNFEIVAVARDVLHGLRDATGHAVSLCTLLDDDLVVMDLMHGRSVVEFTTRPGTRLALHASAHGKIWLAFGPQGLLGKVLSGPRQPWTPHTITDAKTLTGEVQATRKRGWATAPNEAVMGVNTLAAPVLDHRGALAGSIAMVGSTQVLAAKPSPAQLRAVQEAARSVSRDLGWQG
ncbi:MAG: IclR family transcriptional regulator [Xanthobacteraceae bacterium]|nr:IclR family transcriptional regulator [Xanthobacteraceae bacterium]